MNHHNLKFKKFVNGQDVFNTLGNWSIKLVGDTPFVDTKIKNVDSITFDLGKIKNILWERGIKIEALSVGNFYGEEDGSFLRGD